MKNGGARLCCCGLSGNDDDPDVPGISCGPCLVGGWFVVEGAHDQLVLGGVLDVLVAEKVFGFVFRFLWIFLSS